MLSAFISFDPNPEGDKPIVKNSFVDGGSQSDLVGLNVTRKSSGKYKLQFTTDRPVAINHYPSIIVSAPTPIASSTQSKRIRFSEEAENCPYTIEFDIQVCGANQRNGCCKQPQVHFDPELVNVMVLAENQIGFAPLGQVLLAYTQGRVQLTPLGRVMGVF